MKISELEHVRTLIEWQNVYTKWLEWASEQDEDITIGNLMGDKELQLTCTLEEFKTFVANLLQRNKDRLESYSVYQG